MFFRFLIKKSKDIQSPSIADSSSPEPSTSKILTSSEGSSEERDAIEIESDIEPKLKKKKIYGQKFRKEWVDLFPWLEKKNEKAFCKACNKRLFLGALNIYIDMQIRRPIRKIF